MYGVAVIPNVLTNNECVLYRNQIWDELKHVTQNRFDVNDSETWREFYNLYPLHSMLLQHFSLGHMQPLWDIRQHPKVGEVFEKIWNTPKEDLLVSFDGLSIHLPPEQTNRGWYRSEWFHTDQSSEKIGKRCIQGMVSLYDVNENDASLTVLEKSHNYHEDFFDHFDKDSGGDWYRLEEGEKEYFLEKECNPYAIKATAGSVILWDSRTFHQGKEPDKGRESENFRMVSYVCMIPREKAKQSALLKKQKAFNELRVTNHWANAPLVFPKTPRTYGNDLPELNEIHQPVLTDLGRRLAGF
jgi:hypothetical protein